MPERETIDERNNNQPLHPVESNESATKPAFVEPRLSFVTPRLVNQGRLEEKTQSFFGVFTP
jgi:hypothetical protein